MTLFVIFIATAIGFLCYKYFMKKQKIVAQIKNNQDNQATKKEFLKSISISHTPEQAAKWRKFVDDTGVRDIIANNVANVKGLPIELHDKVTEIISNYSYYCNLDKMKIELEKLNIAEILKFQSKKEFNEFIKFQYFYANAYINRKKMLRW